MKIEIPLPLKAERDKLDAELALLQKSSGRLGAAARDLATIWHPHYVKEERFALPPLGLLPAVASGKVTTEMAVVTAMTDNLKAELPQMLQEHARIASAVRILLDAAQQTGDTATLCFGEKLLARTRTEELVMYPAAIILGDWVRHCMQRVMRTA